MKAIKIACLFPAMHLLMYTSPSCMHTPMYMTKVLMIKGCTAIYIAIVESGTPWHLHIYVQVCFDIL